MIVLICGSRTVKDQAAYEMLEMAFKFEPELHEVTKIISGGARGADRLAKNYAQYNNIPFQEYPADWDTYGKSAGYKRNAEMVAVADYVLALHDGVSKGTQHTIKLATQKGIPVRVIPCNVHPANTYTTT